MKIEEEIVQGKFKNEYQKLIINQLFTGRWVTNLIVQQLKPHKITNQQYNVLRILRGQQSEYITVNAIATRMIDKMSNVSRLVDKLVEKELASRRVNAKDRRQMDIKIEKAGLDLIKIIENKEPELYENLKNLNTKEAEQLNYLLDKLRG